MIIISIFGGIGNQMFQYSFGKCLANELNEEFKYDYSYNLLRTDFNPNDIQSIFKLFSLDGQQATKSEIKNFRVLKSNFFFSRIESFIFRKLDFKKRYKHIIEKNEYYDKSLFNNTKSNLYLSGYWQSEKYFISIAETIRKNFEFGENICQLNLDIASEIIQKNSVSVHLRGRDYLSNDATRKNHFICDLEYYNKAFLLIKSKFSNPDFYIFSDDPVWAKSYLKDFNDYNFTFIEGNEWNTSPINDMYLMSLCKHNIIANSSFSWWAAWLNKNLYKTVICPQKWHKEKNHNIDDLIPVNWIKI